MYGGGGEHGVSTCCLGLFSHAGGHQVGVCAITVCVPAGTDTQRFSFLSGRRSTNVFSLLRQLNSQHFKPHKA